MIYNVINFVQEFYFSFRSLKEKEINGSVGCSYQNKTQFDYFGRAWIRDVTVNGAYITLN